MGSNHINITGNNNDTVVDSTVGSVGGTRSTGGEALAHALKELADFVGAERNAAAATALQQMECALQKQPSTPTLAQSHWRQLVTTLPTIMQLPATLIIIRALFGD